MSLAEGLEEGPSPAPSVASPPLQERGTYVLVQIISKWGPGSVPPAVTLERERQHPRGTRALQRPQPGQDPALSFPSNALS